jgi:hypothetical protein
LKRGKGSIRGLATVVDSPLAGLLADTRRRVPDPPVLDEVVEDAGRQRLAAYYLYSALLAGLIGTDDLAPGRWSPELAEPMGRLGLTRFAPRTGRGLDAQLTGAQRATWRSPDRQRQFARLLVELQLTKDGHLAGQGEVKELWEPVAQHLAGMPLGIAIATTGNAAGSDRAARVAHQLEETGISHAVSVAVTLAISVHPLGAAAGLGTRLVRSRIQAGQDEADGLRQLGEELSTLRAEAHRELRDMAAGRNM